MASPPNDTLGPSNMSQLVLLPPRALPRRRALWAPRPTHAQRSLSYCLVVPQRPRSQLLRLPSPDPTRANYHTAQKIVQNEYSNPHPTTRPHVP
jgi:hypothetical protein